MGGGGIKERKKAKRKWVFCCCFVFAFLIFKANIKQCKIFFKHLRAQARHVKQQKKNFWRNFCSKFILKHKRSGKLLEK